MASPAMAVAAVDGDVETLHDSDLEPWRWGAATVEVSVSRPSRAADKLLKKTYQVIDSLSYLDWGKTSDYDAAVSKQGRSSVAAGASYDEGGGRAWKGVRITQTVHAPAGYKEEKAEAPVRGLSAHTTQCTPCPLHERAFF